MHSNNKPADVITTLPNFMTLYEKLRLELIDIEQDLRLSQHVPHFKKVPISPTKSVMRCTEILYDSEELFDGQSETFAITKRVFGCLSVAFTKIFQTVEKITSENNQLQALKRQKAIASVDESKLPKEAEQGDDRKRLGGVCIGSTRRGLDPMLSQPVEESNYTEIMRLRELCRRPVMDVEDQEPQLQLKLDPSEMEHFKTSESTITTTSFLNRIGAHLNSIKQKTDERRQLSFQEHLKSVLVEFQSCQKETTAFINKQAIEMPVSNSAAETDLRTIVDETQQERSRWKLEAAKRVANLIDKSKSRIVGVMGDLQKHIEKLEKQTKVVPSPAERSPAKPKIYYNKQIQTIEAQTNQWILQDYNNKTVLLDQQNKRVAQLEALLYHSRYQLDNTKFESTRLKEYSTLYKQQVETLKAKFNELEQQIVQLNNQNKEFKQQRSDLAESNLENVVDEYADDYSMEMKLVIKSAIGKILGKMGMTQPEQKPTKQAESAQSPAQRISRASRISVKAMDGYGLIRKSLIEQLAEVRRLHDSVVSSVEEHITVLQSEIQAAEEAECKSSSNINRMSKTDSIENIIHEEDEDEVEEQCDSELASLDLDSAFGQQEQNQAACLPPERQLKRKSGNSTKCKQNSSNKAKTSKQTSLIDKYMKRGSMNFANHKATGISPLRKSAKESLFRPKSQDSDRSIGSNEQPHYSRAVQTAVQCRSVEINTIDTKSMTLEQAVQTEPSKQLIREVLEVNDYRPANSQHARQSNDRIHTQSKDEANRLLERNSTGQRILSPGALIRTSTSGIQRRSVKKGQENDPTQARASLKNTPNTTILEERKNQNLGSTVTTDILSTQKELRETVKLSTGDSRLRTRRIDKKKPIAIIVPEGQLISRRESQERLDQARLHRTKSTNKKNQIDTATERILEAGILEEKESDELRKELKMLADIDIRSIPVPQQLNQKTLTELMRSVRRAHHDSCGKEMCKHLIRFVNRIRELVERSTNIKRKTLGVKLHNIREIQTAARNDEHGDEWSRQQELLLR